MLDITELLETLHLTSSKRVLNVAETSKEGELTRVRIPVTEILASDQTDASLRKFARDWLLRKAEAAKPPQHIRVDHRFEPMQTFWLDEETNEPIAPVVGAIVLSWWPRPKVPDYEDLARRQKKRG